MLLRRALARLATAAPAPPRPPRLCRCHSLTTSPTLLARLSTLERRHAAVEAELSSSADIAPPARARLSRELSHLDGVVASISAFRAARAEVADLEAVAAERGAGAEGEELAAMAAAELADTARPQLAAAERDLLLLLLPRDEADDRNVILEIRAGIGGEEAALFAGEVLGMYGGYAAARGWRWAPIFLQAEEEHGGVREAVVEVSGLGAYGRLKFESGVHRVQRVPVTQSTGKLQTSTMTVTVLPEAEEVDVEIKPADLRIDTYRAQGAGGQHVNTTDSAVRITHLPTGTVVSIQDQRSQLQNRVKALSVLRSRLYDAARIKIEEARSKERRSQIGSSGRGERVRTYNFTQSRVTDHRVGLSQHDVEAVMRGEGLDAFIDALREAEQGELLERLLGEEGGGAAGKA